VIVLMDHEMTAMGVLVMLIQFAKVRQSEPWDVTARSHYFRQACYEVFQVITDLCLASFNGSQCRLALLWTVLLVAW
jgi:hypothetical protein